MAKKYLSKEEVKPKLRPAISEEAREGQMIALAMDLVEERLRNGTASSQETTHFLKLASTKHQLELEQMKEQTALMKAKKESLEATQRIEELYQGALEAMRTYSGSAFAPVEVSEEDEDKD